MTIKYYTVYRPNIYFYAIDYFENASKIGDSLLV